MSGVLTPCPVLHQEAGGIVQLRLDVTKFRGRLIPLSTACTLQLLRQERSVAQIQGQDGWGRPILLNTG